MKLYQNRDWLYQKYWGEKLSLRQIAKLCGCSETPIRCWTRKFDIKHRTASEAIKISANRPEVRKRRMMQDRYNIKDKLYGDQGWLYQKYWIEELSTVEIAGICKTSNSIIGAWMERFDIPRRKISDGHLAKTKKIISEKKKKGKYINCIICGEKLWVRPSKFGIKKYCSGKCQGLAKSEGKKVVVQCEDCNKNFEIIKSHYKKSKIKKFLCSKCAKLHKIKIEIKCSICGIIFYALKSQGRICCSRRCARKEVGLKNRRKNTKINKKCPICQITFSIFPSLDQYKKTCGKKNCHSKYLSIIHYGKTHSEEAKKKMSGENAHLWRGGISFEPYGIEFNKQLRSFIRKRDNYQCQECGVKENGKAHNCHHLDYDKRNNKTENFILLCNSCHSKTNSNRKYWQNHFTFSMQLRGEGANNYLQNARKVMPLSFS